MVSLDRSEGFTIIPPVHAVMMQTYCFVHGKSLWARTSVLPCYTFYDDIYKIIFLVNRKHDNIIVVEKLKNIK